MRPRARQSDPETSHEAAKSVRNVGKIHEAILDTFTWCGPMSDSQLIESYVAQREFVGHDLAPKATESSIRSRRAELVKLGRVEDSGEKVKLPTGRMSTVWRLKEGA